MASEQKYIDALSDIFTDMDRLAKAGDEWASEWLVQVWNELPADVRRACGDKEA